MKKSIAVAAAFAVIATAAFAAISFNYETGEGFVGKGEVQTAFGWNNSRLQQNAAALSFDVEMIVVRERSWTCTRTSPLLVERAVARTVESEVAALFSHEARERNQITGFNLTGYQGTPSVTILETTTTIDGVVVGAPIANQYPAGQCPLGATASDDSGWQTLSVTPTIYATFGGDRREL